MPNRYLCDVLEEIRTCQKTQNYSYLSGLLEEAQTMANRMESAIQDMHSIRRIQDTLTSLKTKKKKLEAKIAKIEAHLLRKESQSNET